MKKRRVFLFVVLFLLFSGMQCIGAEEKQNKEEGQEYEKILQEVDKELKKVEQSSDLFSFSALVKQIYGQSSGTSIKRIINYIGINLKKELQKEKQVLLQLFLLGVLSALFMDGGKTVFQGYIGDTGYVVVYLMTIGLLTISFMKLVGVTGETVKEILSFMEIILPLYTLTLTLAGQSLTSTAFYQWALTGIGLEEYIILEFMIPMASLFFVMQMMNYVSKMERFSKMAEFVKRVLIWGLRTMTALIVGFQFIQSLLIPARDKMKNTTLEKSISAIPGFSGGTRLLTSTMIGAGVLIKNCVGVAALVFILVLILVPILKILVFVFSFQFTAAVLQPVADKRMVQLIHSASESGRLLFDIILATASLFMLALAIVTATTNGG